MDKNSIKKYAVWARRELISRVSQKALQYGVSEKEIVDANADTLNGHLLTANEKRQRQSLISRIKQIGYQQTMEEAAYTWFNRFSAIRFMEVNGYLPTHVRIFTDEQNAFKPQILAEAIHLELDGLNMDKVYELKDANKTDELYKYLLITQCNALSSILPRMFTKIENYTALLFPDNLLREGSVIEQMISNIDEKNWNDIEIIGWLYQYYISEKHEEVIKAVGKVTVKKEDVPAATQLFTPDWIVRYMVENSLGRLWVEGHPNDELKANWKYYLEEADQEPEVQVQLDEIRKEYSALKPEEIKVIDPCMGSGHILVYMFDVLVQIYESYGYNAREAAGLILQNNLYGLDIDDRAAQLAYFAVMMKARQYDRRIFSRGIQPHVYSIVESNGITTAPLHDMGLELTEDEYDEAVKQTIRLIDEMHDAKEYGSILNITPCDWDLLRRFAVPRCVSEGQITLDIHGEQEASARLQEIINVAEALSQKYHVVVTNPPYHNKYSPKLKEYVQKNYADYSGDLFSVFIKRDFDYCIKNGFSALMTPNVWMFIKTYEKLRNYVVEEKNIESLIQLAKGSFFKEAAVDIITVVFTNQHITSQKGSFVRLEDFKPDMEVQREKTIEATLNQECHYVYSPSMENFRRIEAMPIAYWCSEKMYNHFATAPKLSTIAPPRQGLATADNNRFLRLWYEVSIESVSFVCNSCEEAESTGLKWFPYNKGGAFRRWFGNRDYVVNWENDGLEIKNFKDDMGKVRSRPQNLQFYFHPSITWSDITSGSFSGRYSPNGSIFDVQGSSAFPNSDILMYLLGFMNSSVSQEILKMLNPTLHTQVGDLSRLPVVLDYDKKQKIETIVHDCVKAAEDDWDTYECSWNYKSWVRCNKFSKIEDAYCQLATYQQNNFESQKEREVLLNQLFIDIYGLNDELTPDVSDSDITIKGVNKTRDIKDFISYAVGCMFGRYSLDSDGIAFAGGSWNSEKYKTFIPDADNIIPICDDEYFNDDITSRFVEFVSVIFGKEHLDENLSFISDALGYTGNARDGIRLYFLNDFYADHCNKCSVTGSGKRPIYWLFDSGKKNGFKALIYMHRYQPDTIARMRTDYVHEQQSRYRTAIADLEQRINSASAGERVKLSKKLQSLQDQADEIRVYEEKIHHLADQMIRIDLDDGVKVNYAKFEDVLAKIK